MNSRQQVECNNVTIEVMSPDKLRYYEDRNVTIENELRYYEDKLSYSKNSRLFIIIICFSV